MNHASLFTGIGGFDLASEWMGWHNLFQCEVDLFCQNVLKHHFPNTDLHGDIKQFKADDYLGRVDVLTGGFPCQPFSHAGKRKGKQDERHLWPEMFRVIRECQPRWIVGENVRGLVNWSGGLVFEEVCADLETCGYAVQSFIIPASGVGAPHQRQRIWVVAHSNHKRGGGRYRQVHQENGEVPQRDKDAQPCHTGAEYASKHPIQARRDVSASVLEGNGNPANTNSGKQRHRQFDCIVGGECQPDTINSWSLFPSVPPLCGGDDGLPKELDGLTFSKWRRESIKAYGNAIVPQVALQIFKAIQAYEDAT